MDSETGFGACCSPVELLAKMITIRVHLDDVPANNAPLLIAPGSHRQGMVPVGKIGKQLRVLEPRHVLPMRAMFGGLFNPHPACLSRHP